MVCAYALRRSGVDAQVLEASPRAGGVIRSERREGFLLELGPQSFSGTAPLRKLCVELGIADQMVEGPARAPRYVSVTGKLLAVPMTLPELLTSSLLGLETKWAIAREFGVDFDSYFAEELARLEAPREDGLVLLDAKEIRTTWLGRIFIRNLAMVFDPYLEKQQLAAKPLFSKTL